MKLQLILNPKKLVRDIQSGESAFIPLYAFISGLSFLLMASGVLFLAFPFLKLMVALVILALPVGYILGRIRSGILNSLCFNMFDTEVTYNQVNQFVWFTRAFDFLFAPLILLHILGYVNLNGLIIGLVVIYIWRFMYELKGLSYLHGVSPRSMLLNLAMTQLILLLIYGIVFTVAVTLIPDIAPEFMQLYFG